MRHAVTDEVNPAAPASEPSDEESIEALREDEEMAAPADFNRDQSVWNSAGTKQYAAPSRYDEPTWTQDSELLGQAPWFDRAAIEEGSILPQYDRNGWISESIPSDILTSWSWLSQFFCYDTDLVVGHNSTLATARRAFAKSVMGGYSRLKTFYRPPAGYSCMFFARTNGEIPY